MKTKTLILILVILTLISVNCAEATETQIFSDDFESGPENWGLGAGWSIVSDNGNLVLQGTQHSFATAYVSGEVQKLEVSLKLLEGGVHLNIRDYTDEGRRRYFIGLYRGNSYITKEQALDFQRFTSGAGISLNEWHRVKIEIIKNTINVYVDDELTLSAQDPDILTEGDISFETLEDSRAYIDDVRVEATIPDTREIHAQELFPNGRHKGDITLQGREFLILENGEFEQFGNIYLKDSSELVIRDSTFKITRYERLLNHWGIHLEDTASLEVENSKLLPGDDPVTHMGTLFIIYANDRSTVTMRNSPTKVHLLTIMDHAKAVVENSEIISDIGGLVGAHGSADVIVRNSKIGAVNLGVPNEATLEVSGLGTGFYEKWNMHENAKTVGIPFNITLINTEIIEDRIGPGPFERGWPVFVESDAHVKIKDSELRKVVITLRDEKAEFANLFLEIPTDFNYRDINLENITVKGQWGIFLHGSSDVVVRDSEAFWTFIYDDSKLTLINTHMNEFDPRNFQGEMIFENSRWDTAAEIIVNNDFIMKGSLKIGEIGGFSWEDSNVTRVYDVIWKPNTELTLSKGEETIWQGKTDENGKASFSIKFNDTNFYDYWELKDNFGNEAKISFFSPTPIKPTEIPQLYLIIGTIILVVALITFLIIKLRKRK